MTSDTDLEKAREWLTPWQLDGLPAYNHPESPTLESAMLESLAYFRAEAVVKGLRLAAEACDKYARKTMNGEYLRRCGAVDCAAAIRAMADERGGGDERREHYQDPEQNEGRGF